MEILAGLPDNISRECLSRVPLFSRHQMAAVCKTWKNTVCSSLFYQDRKTFSLSQQLIILSCFFTQRRRYHLRLDTDRIFARDRKGKNVKVRVEAAWLVMGEKGSIVEAFRQHFQRWLRNDVSSTQELEVSPCNMSSGRTIVMRHGNGPVCESKNKAFHTIRKIICCAGGASKENDVTLIKKL